MDISRLDAWYSSKEGSLEAPATYIVHGLCRRCCLPELVFRAMQVSVSLMESRNTPEDHDELIELVASDETGFLSFFSQQQIQEFMLFEREYHISSWSFRRNFHHLDIASTYNCASFFLAQKSRENLFWLCKLRHNPSVFHLFRTGT